MANPPFTTNRRQLLLGTGALALTRAVPAGSALVSPVHNSRPTGSGAPGLDPACALYLRAVQAEAEVNAFGGDADGPEYQTLYEAYVAAERKLAATPAASLTGIRAKMMRLAADRCWAHEDTWIESWLGLSVVADLDRMIAGQAVYAAPSETTPKHDPSVEEPDYPAYGRSANACVQIH